MADYIEREALLVELGKHFNKVDGRTLYHPSIALAMHDVRSAPTAEVAPVVHGRWVHNDEYVLWAERYICSVCNCNAPSDGDYRHNLSNYCPNCGAKMDLEVSGE